MKINHKTCPGSTLISATRNDSGAVLILVLLLLALLTVVGSSAVTTSTIEVMISSNYN